MADKSGVSDQALPLPQGGGAVEGIGEKFEAEPYTGTGRLTVPIKVPEGRNGFSPALALTYSTGSPNGPFGLGWALSVPVIARKTSTGIPSYGKDDVFVLSGAEDLVPAGAPMPHPLEPACTRQEYRPRVEVAFARIAHVTGPGVDRWEVETRDGQRSWYGCDASAQVQHEKTSRVFAWLLSRTEDTFGNAIRYRYRADPGTGPGGFPLWDVKHGGNECELGREHHQRYLASIEYVEIDNAGQRFLYSIDLDYGEYDDDGDPTGEWAVRADRFSFYRAGFEVRTVRRCQRLLVRLHEPDRPARMVRSYDFEYDNSPANGVSLLRSIQVTGYAPAQPGDVAGAVLANGSRVVGRHLALSMPPLELTYSGFAGRGTVRDLVVEDGALPAGGLDHGDVELVDLDGFGLPGIIRFGTQNGGSARPHRYWPNLGNASLAPARAQAGPPVSFLEPDVNFADMTGRGTADLLLTAGSRNGFYETCGGGQGWTDAVFRAFVEQPTFNLEDRRVQLVDTDGDGRIDVLDTSGDQIQLYVNGGDRWIRVDVEEEAPEVSLGDSNGAVRLADMSGDGPLDIVRVLNGQFDCWPHHGHGRFGTRLTFENPPRVAGQFDPGRVVLTDIDGDGYADYIYLGDDELTVCINRSGNGFSDPIVVPWPPGRLKADSVRGCDMLGTGTAGLLWSETQHADAAEDGDEAARVNYRFLDLTDERKPYLLTGIDNGLGATTTIDYEPSTRQYLRDRGAQADGSKPLWATALPFPVQCVTRVTTADQTTGRRECVEYRYHHGHWDGHEREFRGFARVDRFDTHNGADGAMHALYGDDWSPPLETRTWYHVGPIGRPSGPVDELSLRSEWWAEDRGPDGASQLPSGLAAAARRDALRALRGREIRVEVYGRDGRPEADRPYSVTSAVLAAREIVPKLVYFPYTALTWQTSWERGHDPRWPVTDPRWRVTDPQRRITATLAHDKYGQPLTSVDVAVPRGRDATVAYDAAPEPYLAVVSRYRYAQRDDAHRYIVDRVASAATYELRNDGRPAIDELIASVSAGTAQLAVLDITVNRYDGEAFLGLDEGVGDHGALVRTETLAITLEDLARAYGGEDLPPYFRPREERSWPDEYPEAFRAAVPHLAGHVWRDDAQHEPGFYAVTLRRKYDVQPPRAQGARGLVEAVRDALAPGDSPVEQAAVPHEVLIEYDAYKLEQTRQTNAAGLATSAAYDYGWRLPTRVSDANGSQTAYAYNPLGLLTGVSRMPRPGEPGGDAQSLPGLAMTYDFANLPASVRTVRHRRHTAAGDAGVPPPLERVEYSDGLGRLLQTRMRTEPEHWNGVLPGGGEVAPEVVSATWDPDRVVVSGDTVYDNKGRPVREFAPYFGSGMAYQLPPLDAASLRTKRDPLGRVRVTVAADGSEQRFIQGSCGADLANPDAAVPTPWETYTYDANDNGGRAARPDGDAYAEHWNTPSSTTFDALGHVRATVDRPDTDPAHARVTRVEHDLKGNLIRLADPLGRESFSYLRDRQGRILRTSSLDAGDQVVIRDALGNPVEQRDAKGALRLSTFDSLGRPDRLWARDDAHGNVTLRERVVYGDGCDPLQPQAARAAARACYALGRAQKHYDEAGLVVFGAYDFKGNVVETARRVIRNDQILAGFKTAASAGWTIGPFHIDWGDATTGCVLEDRSYVTTWTYDATDRPIGTRYPADAEGCRRQLTLVRGVDGTVRRIELDGEPQVEQIAYDARGERVLEVLANGVMTRAAYDPATFRLVRLRAERASPLDDKRAWRATGPPLRDVTLTHDATGNLTRADERVPGCGVANSPHGPDRLVREFAYDALYRLTSATGRECASAPLPRPWGDQPSCGNNGFGTGVAMQDNAPQLTARYTEAYEYDPADNLVRRRHQRVNGDATVERAGVGGLQPDQWAAACAAHVEGSAWHEPPSNRLTHLSAATPTSSVPSHRYNDSGELVGQGLAEHYEWDHAGRLRSYRRQVPSDVGAGSSSEPSIYVFYFYDTAGRRVGKVVRRQGGTIEATAYIDEAFERHRLPDGSESTTLHVMDDARRIARHRTGPAYPDDRGPATQYVLADHIGSAAVTLDASGSLVNREEYSPWGETTFGGFARKRYRFGGRERDEQSGLYHFGARLYAPWLTRWISPDRAGLIDGPHLYRYARNNPLTLVDTSGYAATDRPEPDSATGPRVSGAEPSDTANGRAGTAARDRESRSSDGASGSPSGSGGRQTGRSEKSGIAESSAGSTNGSGGSKTFADAQSGVDEAARNDRSTAPTDPSRDPGIRSGSTPEPLDRGARERMHDANLPGGCASRAQETPRSTEPSGTPGDGSTTGQGESASGGHARPPNATSDNDTSGRHGAEQHDDVGLPGYDITDLTKDLYVDNWIARAEKTSLVAFGNVFAQAGATLAEGVLTPFVRVPGWIAGKDLMPGLQGRSMWGVVQGGFNQTYEHIWTH